MDIKILNIDIISDYEGTTSYYVIRSFKFLMQMPCFKAIDQFNYIIWTDCGSQFRSAEFLNFLFNEETNLENKLNKNVCLNFFVEKHGKQIYYYIVLIIFFMIHQY